MNMHVIRDWWWLCSLETFYFIFYKRAINNKCRWWLLSAGYCTSLKLLSSPMDAELGGPPLVTRLRVMHRESKHAAYIYSAGKRQSSLDCCVLFAVLEAGGSSARAPNPKGTPSRKGSQIKGFFFFFLSFTSHLCVHAFRIPVNSSGLSLPHMTASNVSSSFKHWGICCFLFMVYKGVLFGGR